MSGRDVALLIVLILVSVGFILLLFFSNKKITLSVPAVSPSVTITINVMG